MGRTGDQEADLRDHLTRRLAASQLATEPWPYCYIEESLPVDIAHKVGETFDQFNTTLFVESKREKTYRLRTGRIDSADLGSLPCAEWSTVAQVLSGPEYRRAIGELTGIPLDAAHLTLDAWEYRSGDWLAPHVDKADKLVTQIFYLTGRGAADDGGRLLILRTSDHAQPASALPPAAGDSAILVRSEVSWHAVEAPRVAQAHRRTITATFWRGTADAAPN